jgi:hypothetical protein
MYAHFLTAVFLASAGLAIGADLAAARVAGTSALDVMILFAVFIGDDRSLRVLRFVGESFSFTVCLADSNYLEAVLTSLVVLASFNSLTILLTASTEASCWSFIYLTMESAASVAILTASSFALRSK